MSITDRSKHSRLDCSTPAPGSEGVPITDLAVEHKINIFLNEVLAMQVTCSPAYLDELTIGRLFTEGLLRKTSDILSLSICEQGLNARVLLCPEAAAMLSPKKVLSVESCCTDSRNLLSVEETFPQIAPIRWKKEWLEAMFDRMWNGEPLFLNTHSVHACYLGRQGEILCCREDIGRHNALDKAIGYALLNEIPLTECYLFTTGRMPEDIVRKAVRAGIPLLASRTYPTDKGLALARREGLTLITVKQGGTLMNWTE